MDHYFRRIVWIFNAQQLLDGLIALRPDWFVVATPHDRAVQIVPRLLATGARVLVEKPLGRSAAEAVSLARGAAPGQLWVGLSYRFFAGVSPGGEGGVTFMCEW